MWVNNMCLLGRWSFYLLQISAGDKSLINSFREISVMADRLNLPRSIVVSGIVSRHFLRVKILLKNLLYYLFFLKLSLYCCYMHRKIASFFQNSDTSKNGAFHLCANIPFLSFLLGFPFA